MKIAITAATGQLGTAIVSQLKKDLGAESLVGLARSPSKGDQLGIEMRKGDYTLEADFVEALRDIDALMLISANGDPADRIEMHRNVIRAAQKNGLKKIVYTSILGRDEGNSFSPVVKSNRQTEADIKASGLDWAIGRNGIYIEPDLEYIPTYISEGGISNSAGDGRCGYTSREELAVAYSSLLRESSLNGKIYNLLGEPITQTQLAEKINEVFGTELTYTPMSPEDYEADRKAELGEFMGTIISGIYLGIRQGYIDPETHYEQVAGRPHKSALELMKDFKDSQTS